MPTPPAVSSTFAEGRFLDLWFVVHFTTGATGGFSNAFFGLTWVQVFGLAIVLMVGWEIGEHAQGIREHTTNRVVDVFAGLGGVGLAMLLEPMLAPVGERIAFGISLGVSLVGLGFGVLARQRRRRRQRSNQS